jgi:8-oxo-dGTP diphosphatase
MEKLDARKMAFDHREIIDYAWVRLKNKIKYEPIGFELLPKEFTMSDLFDLYGAILLQPLDRRNFVKKILSFDLLKALPRKTEGHVGRRAQLFSFNKEKYNKLKVKGFNFDI